MVAFFTPPPFMSAGPPKVLSYLGSSSSTAATISVPTGIQAGDILILWQRSNNAFGLPTAVNPTGFMSPVLDFAAGSNGRRMLSAKIADGSETVLTGMSGNGGANADAKICVAVRPSWPPSVLTPSVFQYEVTDNAPATQSIAAMGASLPVLAVAVARSSGVETGAGFSMSPGSDAGAGGGSGSSMYVGLQFQNDSSFNTSVSLSDAGNLNTLGSGYFEVA